MNKKLAEWAGFKKCRITKYEFQDTDGWEYPDLLQIPDLPNFAQSLDACFKWLVPKIDFGQMSFFLMEDGSWMCALDYVGKDDDEFEGHGETPALAICKAIEKLIDDV